MHRNNAEAGPCMFSLKRSINKSYKVCVGLSYTIVTSNCHCQIDFWLWDSSKLATVWNCLLSPKRFKKNWGFKAQERVKKEKEGGEYLCFVVFLNCKLFKATRRLILQNSAVLSRYLMCRDDTFPVWDHDLTYKILTVNICEDQPHQLTYTKDQLMYTCHEIYSNTCRTHHLCCAHTKCAYFSCLVITTRHLSTPLDASGSRVKTLTFGGQSLASKSPAYTYLVDINM